MKKIYEKMNKNAFWICLITSICLIVGGFLVPPLGIIDGSVLTSVGLLLGFAVVGVIMNAMLHGADMKITKGDTTIELDSEEK
ncbi:MAG: hypothetical protein J6V33_03140 [Bacteroidales bacterium]|nr:hypothetical protein [Bacteroidales bacterium]